MFRRSKNKVNNFWICNNTQCISNCISEKELDKLITDLILTIITAPHIIQMEEKICKLEILKFEDYKIDSTDFLELLNKEIIKVFESIPKKNKSNEILRYINQYGNGEINLEQLMIYLISEINVSLYDGIKIKLINEKIFSYKYKLKECN